jgi:hypothetical protein
MEMEMDQTEQQYIDRLFDKLRAAEGQSGPRDPEAERYIQQVIARQPSLTYYMAQAIIVQEEALKNAQHQMQEAQQLIEDLERELDSRPAQGAGGGGFLGGLFGGGSSAPAPAQSRSSMAANGGSVPRSGMTYPQQAGQMEPSPLQQYGQQQPYGQPQRGGGFLAGAMQTAAGVAGGVLLGNMLGNMFGGDEAKAAEAAKPEAAATETPAAAPAAEPDPFANVENTQYGEDDSTMGGFFGGGGDFGDDI